MENAVKLNDLEQEIFRLVCGWGCELFKQALERFDDTLMLERDRTVYRHKGPRQTAIKTVMGTVEFKRGVYERKNDDGSKSCVFLLDEALGRNGSGFFSSLLSEQIVRSVCESSYRGGARAVSEQTGQTISPMAAWQVVQNLGARVDEQELAAAKAAEANRGAGELEAKLLFEEQDGIWLNLQGESRKKHGKNKEMKLAIAYDGAKKTGKDRYELTNKVACANFEGAGNFQKRTEGKEYRRMGAMESNVFTIIGNRMKGRRLCWSVNGGNNLARLLCLKFTSKLSDTLQSLSSMTLPERYSEEIITVFSAGKVAKSEGKGYNGFIKSGSAPATPDFKWLRNIGAISSLL